MIEVRPLDRPVDPPPGVVAVLPEALVAILWWRGVAMRRAEPVSMTPLERLTLEMALSMGRAEPGEFLEITGLPGALLPIAARRLVAARALAPVEGGYVPQSPGAARAARTQTVYEQRHASLDIVLLPRTGDLLALDPRSSGLRAVEGLRPRSVGNAPVPSSLMGKDLAGYLRGRLRERTIAGVGEDIIDVALLAGEAPPLTRNGWCPVYRCQGEIRSDGERHLPVITLPGNGSGDPVKLELPGADGLTRRWLALADTIGGSTEWVRAWRAIAGQDDKPPPRVERAGPGRWTCWLAGPDARRLAGRDRNLALPVGFTLRDEEAVLETTIDLAGADHEAEDLMRTDAMLTAAAEPGADTTSVPRTRDVWQRAWRLGFPGLVYALRETEDFRFA